jgi:hypothetical protein
MTTHDDDDDNDAILPGCSYHSRIEIIREV